MAEAPPDKKPPIKMSEDEKKSRFTETMKTAAGAGEISVIVMKSLPTNGEEWQMGNYPSLLKTEEEVTGDKWQSQRRGAGQGQGKRGG